MSTAIPHDFFDGPSRNGMFHVLSLQRVAGQGVVSFVSDKPGWQGKMYLSYPEDCPKLEALKMLDSIRDKIKIQNL